MTQDQADQLKEKNRSAVKSYEIEIVATLLPLILAKFKKYPTKDT